MRKDMGPYESAASSVQTNVARTDQAYFFTTSTLKLAVMSVCTCGIYELYWFYKNWVLIKDRTGKNIMPFWRAFFGPLWAGSCFEHIKSAAIEKNVPESLSIIPLAVAYLGVHVLWQLPDPYWLVTFLSFTLIIPANNVALNINQYLISDFTNNSAFSGWNWVAIVLGGFFFTMAVTGALIGAFFHNS